MTNVFRPKMFLPKIMFDAKKIWPIFLSIFFYTKFISYSKSCLCKWFLTKFCLKICLWPQNFGNLFYYICLTKINVNLHIWSIIFLPIVFQKFWQQNKFDVFWHNWNYQNYHIICSVIVFPFCRILYCSFQTSPS